MSTPTPKSDFLSFTRSLIAQLQKVGKTVTARRFTAVLSSFSAFLDADRLPWSRFDSTLVSGYEHSLLARGLCRNTSSFYIRNLRSIVRRAADLDITIPRNPFRYVYTGIDRTVKRSIPLDTLRRIRDLDLSDSPSLSLARDLFLFSFYTRGMSFIDIAYLRKTDIRDGYIHYSRRKTRRPLAIHLEPRLLALIRRFNTPADSPWLLPLLPPAPTQKDLHTVYHRINRNLRKIGERLTLSHPLTLYVARHTWASLAHTNSIPISTISHALGHDSESTTRIYLSTIDTQVVDTANRLLLSLLP